MLLSLSRLHNHVAINLLDDAQRGAVRQRALHGGPLGEAHAVVVGAVQQQEAQGREEAIARLACP